MFGWTKKEKLNKLQGEIEVKIREIEQHERRIEEEKRKRTAFEKEATEKTREYLKRLRGFQERIAQGDRGTPANHKDMMGMPVRNDDPDFEFHKLLLRVNHESKELGQEEKRQFELLEAELFFDETQHAMNQTLLRLQRELSALRAMEMTLLGA